MRSADAPLAVPAGPFETSSTRVEQPVGDLVELDEVVERLAERLVHQGDRRRPGARPPRARPAPREFSDATALQPQQRRDGLQVVLDPVVDLADRRVLRDQLALAQPQLGDVAQQDQGAVAAARRPQRDRCAPAATPGRSRSRPRTPSVVRRAGRARRGRWAAGPTRPVVTSPEVRADQVAGQPEPPVGRHRVGARVADGPCASVRMNPSPTRSESARSDRAPGTGNSPRRIISTSSPARLEVGALEGAGRAQRRLAAAPGDDPDRPRRPAHRDGLDQDAGAVGLLLDLLGHALARREGDLERVGRAAAAGTSPRRPPAGSSARSSDGSARRPTCPWPRRRAPTGRGRRTTGRR